jgi:methylmalonyl-CoA mutase cobalamin-binding subunit
MKAPAASKLGEPPVKILITSGLDGHGRDCRVIALFLRDAGMELLYTPPCSKSARSCDWRRRRTWT